LLQIFKDKNCSLVSLLLVYNYTLRGEVSLQYSYVKFYRDSVHKIIKIGFFRAELFKI